MLSINQLCSNTRILSIISIMTLWRHWSLFCCLLYLWYSGFTFYKEILIHFFKTASYWLDAIVSCVSIFFIIFNLYSFQCELILFSLVCNGHAKWLFDWSITEQVIISISDKFVVEFLQILQIFYEWKPIHFHFVTRMLLRSSTYSNSPHIYKKYIRTWVLRTC